VRRHFRPVGTAMIKKTKGKVLTGMWNGGNLCTLCGKVNLYSHKRKVWKYSKNDKKGRTTVSPRNLLLCVYLSEINQLVRKTSAPPCSW
jgi:hypothetical protein